MSIATQLNDIVDLKETIKEALIAKGVNVDDNFSLSSIPDVIESGISGDTGDMSSFSVHYPSNVVFYDNTDKKLKISRDDAPITLTSIPDVPGTFSRNYIYIDKYKDKILVRNTDEFYLLNEDLTWTTIPISSNYRRFVTEFGIMYITNVKDLYVYDDNTNTFNKIEISEDFANYISNNTLEINSFKINNKIIFVANLMSGYVNNNFTEVSMDNIYYSYDTPTNWTKFEFPLSGTEARNGFFKFNDKVSIITGYSNTSSHERHIHLYEIEPDFSSYNKRVICDENTSGFTWLDTMYFFYKVTNGHLILRTGAYMNSQDYFIITEGTYELVMKSSYSSTDDEFYVVNDGKTLITWYSDTSHGVIQSYKCISYDYGKTWSQSVPSAYNRFYYGSDFTSFKYDIEPFKLCGLEVPSINVNRPIACKLSYNNDNTSALQITRDFDKYIKIADVTNMSSDCKARVLIRKNNHMILLYQLYSSIDFCISHDNGKTWATLKDKQGNIIYANSDYPNDIAIINDVLYIKTSRYGSSTSYKFYKSTDFVNFEEFTLVSNFTYQGNPISFSSLEDVHFLYETGVMFYKYSNSVYYYTSNFTNSALDTYSKSDTKPPSNWKIQGIEILNHDSAIVTIDEIYDAVYSDKF